MGPGLCISGYACIGISNEVVPKRIYVSTHIHDIHAYLYYIQFHMQCSSITVSLLIAWYPGIILAC